jgi:ferrochelatase
MKERTALILMNVGTPDGPAPSDVAKYLKPFLNDPRVIDIPQPWRFLLVNFAIIPFRKYSSSRKYQSIWTEKGSPLLYLSQSFHQKLQEFFRINNTPVDVFFSMRYGNPSLSSIIKRIQNSYSRIFFFPLYPQYASSTTASAFDYLFQSIKPWQGWPSLHLSSFFFHEDFFLRSYAKKITEFHPQQYDAVVFSYHGLPHRQIRKCSEEKNYRCLTSECCSSWNESNLFCYRAQCEETTRRLATLCHLPLTSCYTTFQSRLSRDWLNPFTDKTLEELARKGIKKILIVTPAFVTDCLETIEEIGMEGEKIFLQSGGEKFDRVPCLNDDEFWVQEIGNYLTRKLM